MRTLIPGFYVQNLRAAFLFQPISPLTHNFQSGVNKTCDGQFIAMWVSQGYRRWSRLSSGHSLVAGPFT